MTEPWLLTVPFQNAPTLVLHTLESFTGGQNMRKGTSEPRVAGDDSSWPSIVPHGIAGIRCTAKWPGSPQRGSSMWDEGAHGTPLQVVESLLACKQAMGPAGGVGHDAEMQPSTSILQ